MIFVHRIFKSQEVFFKSSHHSKREEENEHISCMTVQSYLPIFTCHGTEQKFRHQGVTQPLMGHQNFKSDNLDDTTIIFTDHPGLDTENTELSIKE